MPAKKTTNKATSSKVVPKKAAKKVTKKTTQKSTKKNLVQASQSTSFWVSDGQILNSLIALKDAFGHMSKEVYIYHATGTHNDFANWVEVVLCDAKCAKDLRKAKTPRSAKIVVVRHLKSYAV